jgi:hypothetical protein
MKFHPKFLDLDCVNSPTVNTAAAAFYLGRRQQTLREWACKGSGPITPIRINSRLAWKTEELRQILGGAK